MLAVGTGHSLARPLNAYRICHTVAVSKETDNTPDESGANISISSLFAGSEAPYIEFDGQLFDTAMKWQTYGSNADFEEMHAVVMGAEPGRMYIIVGRIASAGEQLALAGVAYRDARGWLSNGGKGAAVRVPARALAEVVSYFAISTAHGLANATARLLALEERSRAILLDRDKSSRGFTPFDPKDTAWLPINRRTVESLEAASVHHQPAVLELVALLRSLVDDKQWSGLVERRHTDFHRWRPQSVDSGVSTTSPWLDFEDFQVLAVRDGGTFIPMGHEEILSDTRLGLERLEATMRAWIELFPAARDSVITYVAAKSMGNVDLDCRDEQREDL